MVELWHVSYICKEHRDRIFPVLFVLGWSLFNSKSRTITFLWTWNVGGTVQYWVLGPSEIPPPAFSLWCLITVSWLMSLLNIVVLAIKIPLNWSCQRLFISLGQLLCSCHVQCQFFMHVYEILILLRHPAFNHTLVQKWWVFFTFFFPLIAHSLFGTRGKVWGYFLSAVEAVVSVVIRELQMAAGGWVTYLSVSREDELIYWRQRQEQMGRNQPREKDSF